MCLDEAQDSTKKFTNINTVNLLTTDVPHHIETSQLIRSANQSSALYMVGNING